MTDQSLREVARAAVADVSPDELNDFDDIARAFAANPTAARRARRGRGEPMANAYAQAGEYVTTVLLAVVADISKDAVLAGGRRGLAGLRRWRGRRKVDLEAELTAVREQDVPKLHRDLSTILREHVDDPTRAERLTAALLRAWPRRG